MYLDIFLRERSVKQNTCLNYTKQLEQDSDIKNRNEMKLNIRICQLKVTVPPDTYFPL